MEVSREFVKKFTGTRVDFTSFNFEVSKNFIAEATRFPTEGEKWFKKFSFEVDLNMFLIPD